MAENMKDLNRIKVVLVEKKRTNKWLAEQLGKDPATIHKRAEIQPSNKRGFSFGRYNSHCFCT